MAHLLKNRRVSLLSLRAFVALMRHRDLGRAAAELGIQPQRLHYQLRSLEFALDTALFRVCSPHWLPTPAAIRVLPRAQRVLAMWREILDSLAREPAAQESALPPYGPVAFWVRQATM
jgi:DNA-binding transcriptional LysR family regulator